MADHIRLWRVRFRVLAPWGGDLLGYTREKFVIARSRAEASELVLASKEWEEWYSTGAWPNRGGYTPAPSITEVKLLAVSGPIMEQMELGEGRE